MVKEEEPHKTQEKVDLNQAMPKLAAMFEPLNKGRVLRVG
jgi:hypothetical protein